MKDKSWLFLGKVVIFYGALCFYPTNDAYAYYANAHLAFDTFNIIDTSIEAPNSLFLGSQVLEFNDFAKIEYLISVTEDAYPVFPNLSNNPNLSELNEESETPPSQVILSNSTTFEISGLKFSGRTALNIQKICEVGLEVINSHLIDTIGSPIQIKKQDLKDGWEVCTFSNNAEITFEILSNVRAAIDSLYIEQGYITSGSYIPEQFLSQGGSVEASIAGIIISEGRLSSIEIDFKDSYGEIISDNRLHAYVCDRLKLYLGSGQESFIPGESLTECKFSGDTARYDYKPVTNLNSITNALDLLRIDPLFHQVESELKPAEGSSDASLTITLTLCKDNSKCQNIGAVQSIDGFIATNNNRSPAIGNIERQAQISLFDFLGSADRLTIGLSNTDGSNKLALQLYLPLNGFGESLSLSYERYSGRLLEAPFNRLDLTSNSEQFNLSLRRSLGTITTDRELFLDVSGGFYNSTSFVLGEPFPVSLLEADEEGRTLVLSLAGSLSGLYRAPDNIFAWRTGIEFGSNVTPQQSAFAILSAQSQYYQKITENTFFLFRNYGQIASGSLPAVKQIGIGGQTSVRGYRPSFLLTDNGVLSTAEIQWIIFSSANRSNSIQVIPFFDVAYGWNNSDLLTPANLAMSTGLGIQLELGQSFFARLDYGIPLVSAGSSSSNLQNLYFSLSFNPFSLLN